MTEFRILCASILRLKSDIATPNHVLSASQRSGIVDLPSWARNSLKTPVVDDSNPHPTDPAHLAKASHSSADVAASEISPSRQSNRDQNHPQKSTLSATARPIARWRRAVKRASLEQQRRQSMNSPRGGGGGGAGARGKLAMRAKEKIKTPTKNKENEYVVAGFSLKRRWIKELFV